MNQNQNKIVLHLCCGVCGVYLVELLKKEFSEVCLYFYNPNIHPQKEYEKRKITAQKLAEIMGLTFIEGEYRPEEWLEAVKSLKEEPEGGRRCEICFEKRLRTTAQFAKKKGFSYFTTSLIVSPFKDEKLIKNLGEKIAQEIGCLFFDPLILGKSKEEIWKETRFRAKQYNFYHQNYCGCIFSLRRNN